MRKALNGRINLVVEGRVAQLDTGRSGIKLFLCSDDFILLELKDKKNANDLGRKLGRYIKVKGYLTFRRDQPILNLIP